MKLSDFVWIRVNYVGIALAIILLIASISAFVVTLNLPIDKGFPLRVLIITYIVPACCAQAAVHFSLKIVGDEDDAATEFMECAAGKPQQPPPQINQPVTGNKTFKVVRTRSFRDIFTS